MNPETLFLILNNLVAIVWVLMIFAPKWKITQTIISTFSVVLLLSVTYSILIISSFGTLNFMDFTSLQGVMNLLQNSDAWGSSTLWYHFLAFDLFVGTWILKDAQKLSIPHLLIIPCLFFTFMLGPLGFVLYQLVKFLYPKFGKNKQNVASS